MALGRVGAKQKVPIRQASVPKVSKDMAVDSYCAVVGEEILSGDGLALPEGGPCEGTRVRHTDNAFAGHERRVPHKRVIRSGNLLLLGVEHVLSDGGIGNAIKEQLCSCSSMVPRALHSQCALERRTHDSEHVPLQRDRCESRRRLCQCLADNFSFSYLMVLAVVDTAKELQVCRQPIIALAVLQCKLKQNCSS